MRALTGSLRACVPLVLLLMASCGGGDGSGSSSTGTTTPLTGPNVVSVVVDDGPTSGSGSVNTLFATVTVCVPGSTTQCQTIDHIQVDTGSYGLRILAPVLTLSLPVNQAADGNSLLECTQFADGYSWGPVASADIQISGESASSVPIQVIGTSNFTSVPSDCASTGTAEDTVASFGANGILGIGVFEQDCGSGCVSNPANGFYYSCNLAGSCAETAVSLADQVINPVTRFATDNNGTILKLPSVSSPGAATLTGSLIFGIDTQTNNASGSQTVLTVDADNGDFTIVFNGQTLTQSFIDSGTNGIFFNDSGLPQCSESDFSGFYCPSSTQGFTVTLTGINAVSVSETFQIDNAETLATNNPSYTVLPTLGGTFTSSSDTFDFGLPFYYGRSVATAIEGHSTSVNTGPYVAF